MVCCMCFAWLVLCRCVCVCVFRICLNVLLCICICECFMTHPKLLKIPLDWIRYDFLFYTFLLSSSVLICVSTQLLSRTSVCLMKCANASVCDLWDLPLVTSVMKNRRWDQTQTLLITTLEIKLAAHWWIFHCHQHSENTSLIYLEVSFVLPLFAWSSIYIKPHLDRIILCNLRLSTSSMISLIRSLSFVPLLQIPQLQIFSYTEIS